MATKFGWLSKLTFLQDIMSTIISFINTFAINTIEKYITILKCFQYKAIEGIEGDYLEFGVFGGSSFVHAIKCYKKTKFIAPNISDSSFYGFDSFEGFGDASVKDEHPFFEDQNFEVKYNQVAKRIKKYSKNINYKLIKGFYSESLNLKHSYYNINKASIIMIDCDLYDSAKLALDFCKPIIQKGTIIVLDEALAYKASLDHGEICALNEFLSRSNLEIREFMRYGLGGIVYVVSKI
jgi:hypothetical protein